MPKRKVPPEKIHETAEAPADGDGNVPNKKLAAAEADAKASSDTEGNTTNSRQTDEPPPYGSQEYWENRYAESASAGHSWYFTYDELRPLLLPLLLGRDGADASAEDDKDDGEEWEEVGDDDDEDEEAVEAETKDDEGMNDDEEDGDEDTMNNSPKAEAENESNSDGDDDEDGGTPYAQEEHPPKSVLEVGCGDVPLGHALLLDLLSMQRETGADANLVVKEIVCNDYAKSVIDVLREQQKKHWNTGGVKGSYETADGRDGRKIERLALDRSAEGDKEPAAAEPTLDVTYVVEDARDMAYRDESFDLIIDKGTSDALLSDKEEGINNCVRVVSEMGRCATIGGFIMVVSHMNAHCDAGIDWCDRVLVDGLRASQADASWEIEVHGSDGSDAAENVDGEKDNDEEGDNDGPPSGSPGPAVYIIHKLPSKQRQEKTEDGETGSKDGTEGAVIDTIPLKFFTY